MQDKIFLTPQEVEAIYGIKTNTLAQWRCKRKGPDYFKVGSKVKYSVEELNKFMEGNRIRCYRTGE